MPAYHYVAMNQGGSEKKGVMEAENEREVRQLLREQSLFPLAVHAAKINKKNFTFPFLNKIRDQIWQNGLSSKELALITRQFATLLAAGLPIAEALLAVSEQVEKPHVKGIILSVRGKVLEGHALHAALGEHPYAFPALFCATIASGEKSGHLDKILLRLAEYTEAEWQMQQKFKTALIYPVMIVLVAICIVGFLLEYVVPKMIAVYGRLGQSLPLITKILIAISGFIKNDGLYIFIFLIVSVYIGRSLLKRNEGLREKMHRFLLKMPVIGYAIKTANTARFARTLSILSASGVPVLEAMRIAAQLITTIPIHRAVKEAVSHVREGAAIHLALKQTKYFPPISIHMIASGEASGQLENMLERVAANQESELTRLIDVSLTLFEPAIILIMGAVVLFIVLAVLLPIFDLNQF